MLQGLLHRLSWCLPILSEQQSWSCQGIDFSILSSFQGSFCPLSPSKCFHLLLQTQLGRMIYECWVTPELNFAFYCVIRIRLWVPWVAFILLAVFPGLLRFALEQSFVLTLLHLSSLLLSKASNLWSFASICSCPSLSFSDERPVLRNPLGPVKYRQYLGTCQTDQKLNRLHCL